MGCEFYNKSINIDCYIKKREREHELPELPKEYNNTTHRTIK